MAARLNRRHQEMVREKIRASQLVNRLENHILGDEDGKPVDMTATQVNAALGLLRKVVPDLKATDMDIQGQLDVPLSGTVRFVKDDASPSD